MKKAKMKSLWRLIIFVVLISIVFLLDLCSVYAAKKDGNKNEFYPGDAIRITVIEVGRDSERRSFNISGDYKTNSLGYIILPLIGNVKVIGHDRASLATYLVELYSPYLKEPYITTMPLIRVALMGAFNHPGSYRISPEASLWELIEMADGPKEHCDLNSIRLERGGRVIIKNLLKEFEEGYSLEDIGIKSGDQIISRGKSSLGIREIMNYSYFVMSAVSLYLTIRNYNK